MFDIGFPELLLVSVVALLVIGPERLPETIRTIMLWLGRIRQGFSNIKREIEQEIGADEIRQQLHNETVLRDLRESKQQVEALWKDTGDTIKDADNSIRGSINEASKPAQPSEPSKPIQQPQEEDETPSNHLADANDSSDRATESKPNG